MEGTSTSDDVKTKDLQRIGFELQTLLKIPSIKKVDMTVMEGATSNKPLADILQVNATQKNDFVKGNKRTLPVDVKKTDNEGGHNGQRGKSLLATPPATITPPVVIRQAGLHSHQVKMHKEAKSFGAKRNEMKPLGSQSQNEIPSNNMSNNNNDGPQTLVQLLQRIDCPPDLQEEKSTLIDYAYRERNGGGSQIASQIKRILSSHGIEALSKRSSKFPKAKFICNSCNYHMDNIYACVLHIIASVRHTTYEYMKKLEFTLVHIPEPSHEHCLSISRFLSSVYQQYTLQDTEVERRKRYVARLNHDLKASNIGNNVVLELFGSSYTSLGFKDSDININISTEGTTNTPADNFEILQQLFLFFQHHPSTLEVKKMVSSKSATIHFRENEYLCEVTVSMNNTAATLTSRLFAEYVKLSQVVRPLVIALRRWAEVCEIDNQDRGSLPPHAFTIMVLYFLQQIEVLPNLHHLRAVYCKEIETGDGKMKDFASAEEALNHWKPCSPRLTGSYWIDMIRFYALEFNYKEHVVSISQPRVYRSDKYWNRKISIEDPVIPKSNLSRSMSNNRMCEYILERFKFTYLYFGVPRTIRGPLYDGIMALENVDKCRQHVFHKVVLATNTNTKPLEKLTNPLWDPVSLAEEVKVVKWNGHVQFPATDIESVRVRMHSAVGSNHKEKTSVYIEDAKILESIFPEWLYDYKFDQAFLQNGMKPPVICKSCGVEGHIKSDCPDEILPELKPVMNVSVAALRLLNDVLWENFQAEALNDEDVQIRRSIIEELQQTLLPLYPEAQLNMFGSTYNGFGVHLSDIDVCLTFRNRPASETEGSNGITILRAIVERLKSAGFLQEVVAIPSAKVPIIKFCHRKYNLEGDISLYNTLAMHNTRLLRTYADIDRRVKIMGCFVKKLTKLCDISDASRGSLSSYGYVLMVIHYFQHLPAPVLPVLQELCRDSRQSVIIEGCDIQHFQDIHDLHRVWPMYGRNRQSLSEYAPLTRIAKYWLTDAIAIEDPFERNHNLGAGLSRRMSVHILKTFHHLRDVFHATYDSHMLKKHPNWLSFFTDQKLLQNGNPPLDRQCRICHKIGHFARNCTFHEKNGDDQTAGKNDKKTAAAPTLVDLVDEKVRGQSRSKNVQKTVAEIENLPERSISSENNAEPLKDIREYPMEKNECHDGTEKMTWRAVTGLQVTGCPSGPVRNEEAFPQFFDAQTPEDEMLLQMTTKRASKSPGVEFVLKEDSPKPLIQQNNLNFGMFLPFNDYQNSIVHNPMYPSMNQMGVTFMGSPFSSQMGMQFMSPNMSIQVPPPPGFEVGPSSPAFICKSSSINPMNGHYMHMGAHPMFPHGANMGQMMQHARPEQSSTPTIVNGDSSSPVMPRAQNPDSPGNMMNGMDRVCLPNLQSHMPPFSQLLSHSLMAQQFPRVNDN